MTAAAPLPALPALIATRTVADLLHIAPATLRRQLDELIEVHGFPEPYPHIRRPLHWRRDRVLAWLDEQGRPRPPAAPGVDPALVSGGKVAILAEARRA